MEKLKSAWAMAASIYDWCALLIADHPRLALALMIALAVATVF